MGRNETHTAEEVNEILEDQNGGNITVAEIAKRLECTPQTVRTKLRKLRVNGEPILYDKDGLYKMLSVESREDIYRVEKYHELIVRCLIGLARCGGVTKPLLLEAKKIIREKLSLNERKQLAAHTSAMTRMLDVINTEEEFEE
jgi:biotin operon repressor